MEIFGGFMVMMSILGFFLVVIWFTLPFVVFIIKGRVERSLLLLESIDRRLTALEERFLATDGPAHQAPGEAPPDTPPSEPPPPDAAE